jgi:LmbE family N-acetylglucosaminyl deacetylase
MTARTERTFGQPATPRLDQHIERVLVVTAHPDDCDFGAAGTVAGWVDAGLKVTILLCTHGEQGGFEDSNREQMPLIREREQIAASAALGVTDVRFLPGHRDGWLEPSWELQTSDRRGHPRGPATARPYPVPGTLV